MLASFQLTKPFQNLRADVSSSGPLISSLIFFNVCGEMLSASFLAYKVNIQISLSREP